MPFTYPRKKTYPDGTVSAIYIWGCQCDTPVGPSGGVCKCGGAIPGPGEPGYQALEAGQCCRKAHRIECVCVKAWDCPTHGQTHVGSHD